MKVQIKELLQEALSYLRKGVDLLQKVVNQI
jgi:hypothetical protein